MEKKKELDVENDRIEEGNDSIYLAELKIFILFRKSLQDMKVQLESMDS